MIGYAISAFFLGSTVTAPFGGRLADRWGIRRTAAAFAALSATSAVGIAVVDSHPLLLLVFAVSGGVANGLAQPVSTLVLSTFIDSHRQGIGFGIRQAAIPIATLLAGISVPTLSGTLGWRWVFAIIAPVAVGTAALIPGNVLNATRTQSPTPGPQFDRWLTLTLAGAALGAAANITLGTFLVDSLVHAGYSNELAAGLLIVGSLSGIAVRLTAGWFSDQGRPATTRWVSCLVGIGAIGFFGLAAATTALPVATVATIVAFGFGWGWTGLLFHITVRARPSAVGSAAGYVQIATSGGSLVGSAAFGAIAAAHSFPTAWGTFGAVMLLSAALLWKA